MKVCHEHYGDTRSASSVLCKPLKKHRIGIFALNSDEHEHWLLVRRIFTFVYLFVVFAIAINYTSIEIE